MGTIASIVISTLISHGKLTAHEISSRSKLPIKTVKSALVSLIQLNCIYYWLDERKTVHYSFNERGLLVFVHSGDIINCINKLYDAESAEIIQNIIQMGHVRVLDYLAQYQDDKSEKTKLYFEQQTRFYKLFADGWLQKLQPFHYSPINDLWSKLYQETLKQIPRNATTSEVKRVNEAKEKTKVKLSDLLESGQESKDLYEMDGGLKTLRNSLVISFNLSRFEKHLRSRALVNFSKSKIGSLTSKVYEAALSTIEQKTADLSQNFLQISGLISDPEEARLLIHSVENKLVDQKQTTFQVRDLARHLDNEVDLRNSILTHNFLKPQKRVNLGGESAQKKIKLEDGGSFVVKEENNENEDENDNNNFFNAMISGDSFDNSDDKHSHSLILSHLKLLTSSTPVNFLIEVSPGVFTVPLTSLMQELKQHNFDNIIKTTLGVDAFKILRCLRMLKLADEKTIAEKILLKEKTVRNEVCKLINLNAVEIQEIPKSADRAALKTFYLFRHKCYISYLFLSNSLIYNMGEILNNIESFKSDHKILLEKCEREDVKGNEDQLLLDSELKTLRKLQSREINNMGKFNRLKSLNDIFGVF